MLDDVTEEPPVLMTSLPAVKSSSSKLLIEDITVSVEGEGSSTSLQGQQLSFTGIQDMTETCADSSSSSQQTNMADTYTATDSSPSSKESDMAETAASRPSSKESEKFLQSLAASVPLSDKSELNITAANTLLGGAEESDEDERVVDSDLEDLD